MLVKPQQTYEAVIEVGETGLVGTLGLRVNDNLGTTSVAFDSSNVVEIAAGVYAKHGNVAPTSAGQYTLIWTRGSAGEVLGTEDLTVAFNAPTTGPFYGTTTELARILKIRNPSPEQTAAMERVLTMATIEVNAEIDLATDSVLTDSETAVATEVALERAVEHWRSEESPFGLVGLGGLESSGPAFASTNSWERHAFKLRMIKDQFGIA